MCGRFTQRLPSSEFARIFDAEDRLDSEGGAFNVAPTDPVAVVVAREGRRAVVGFRWGLVPRWAGSVAIGSRMINARAETVEQSRAFGESFRRRRCIVPADGFYEWLRDPDGARRPYYIGHADGSPLAFAGLWASWRGPGLGDPVRSCTIVTTTANELVARLHDRMPVVLGADRWARWLDEDADPGELHALLQPAAASGFTAVPVSSRVNSVRNQEADLVVPIGAPLLPWNGGA